MQIYFQKCLLFHHSPPLFFISVHFIQQYSDEKEEFSSHEHKWKTCLVTYSPSDCYISKQDYFFHLTLPHVSVCMLTHVIQISKWDKYM